MPSRDPTKSTSRWYRLITKFATQRANIGNARLAGLERDLGLAGYDYNIILTCFYVPYIIFELPSVWCCELAVCSTICRRNAYTHHRQILRSREMAAFHYLRVRPHVSLHCFRDKLWKYDSRTIPARCFRGKCNLAEANQVC